MSPARRRFAALLIFLFLPRPTWPAASSSSASPPPEYQVKAAFLYNFAKFVDWPEEALPPAEAPFVIGLLGDDPFGQSLDGLLKEKLLKDRKITLRRISDAAAAKECHVLFISASEQKSLTPILKTLEGQPVLVVGDMDQFIQRGGMIGFTLENHKVRFNINKDAADAAHLKLSSELLKLAKTVQGSNATGGQ